MEIIGTLNDPTSINIEVNPFRRPTLSPTPILEHGAQNRRLLKFLQAYGSGPTLHEIT
jgi:hypothetical protein